LTASQTPGDALQGVCSPYPAAPPGLLGRGERGVGKLQNELGVTKANISQHLTILKSAGVVITRRSGKQVYAALAIPEVKQACQLIHKVLRTQLRKQHRLAG
jgi:ArsR family transcriptional regulator